MALPQDGQDANGLTKVTQIPAGKELMFIDPTTNEGGIITLEDLTKQILNGLLSQTFALDAGQKTIIQALNTLNSDLDDRIGVDKKFTSGTLLNIINQMSNGIHMALVGETVSGIPFSNTENYIIVFKGTSYGNPYTRIMVFPMSKSSAPKWGMVFWDNSKIVWA